MTVAIMDSKRIIIISILVILVVSGPNDSSKKSSRLLECNEDGSKTSLCSLSSWFKKISDPSFECKKQEFDATGGINYF